MKQGGLLIERRGRQMDDQMRPHIQVYLRNSMALR